MSDQNTDKEEIIALVLNILLMIGVGGIAFACGAYVARCQ